VIITIVAIVCQITGPVCVEKIVAQSDSMATCMLGQAAMAQWMATQPAGWRLSKWRCVPGKYTPRMEI
jgi:hypothetical protein